MQLYFFNPSDIKPFIFLIVRVLDDEEYEYITANFTNIFELLIEDNLASKDDLLVFSLIKEHTLKIENLIQPFSHINYDKADDFNNHIIIKTLKSHNCYIYFDCSENILLKKKCNLNMEFLCEKYE